ncbi:hypothetical protein KIN20_023258 [Parelaphostrongylus tenuis]|uniref:Uncharacterized protein n=1 Tax=Parelaphostrongylus tenuis TaxID=148309 RepID=A0AAD5QVA7_PARTN|nr:hypothetical protein KIN20_023258 [Parelaphostrongylus tenuis]
MKAPNFFEEISQLLSPISRSDNARNLSAISNVMTYGDFRTRYPEIRWQLFFNEELRSSLGVLNDDVMVNVVDVGYFGGLTKLIKSKSLSSIKNYLMWRLVSTFDTYLHMPYRHPAQKFRSNVFGTTAEVRIIRFHLKLIFRSKTEFHNGSIAFVKLPRISPCRFLLLMQTVFFPIKNRNKIEELITDLKRSMERIIVETDWMDEVVKKVALRKLENMGYKTGFPTILQDEIAVLNLYKGVQLEAHSYFGNALQLKKLAIRNGLNRLHNPPSKDHWVSPVIAVDAYHYFTGNEIIFPAAILQFPIFVPEAPSYVNYGAIGFGIGHEITHGYDDLGAQYDEVGNLRAWWNQRTLATYQKKRQCFIKQYSKKVEPTLQKNVDGRLTIGENIADNGGLRLAYEAYKMRCSREDYALALPKLSTFSPEQLFFVAFANTWCEKVKTSALIHTMESEVHPLGMFRVNVPLQNFPPFSEAFQCPIGSAMNPREKCRIW